MTTPGPIFGDVERERDRWERQPYGRFCVRCGKAAISTLCVACAAALDAEGQAEDERRERAREAEEELRVDEKRDKR